MENKVVEFLELCEGRLIDYVGISFKMVLINVFFYLILGCIIILRIIIDGYI